MNIRTKDANGKWSLSNRNIFYKAPTLPTGGKTKLVQVEYFIDTDPGFGKGVPLPFLADTTINASPIKVNVTGLTNGKHRLVLRVKDESGNWSISNVSEFNVSGSIPAPFITVTGIDKKVHCAGDSFMLGYHATGIFNNGNQFTAWLSNATGSFASEQLIGTVAVTGSGLMGIKLPPHVASGTGYRIRVKSSNTLVVGDANGIAITINDRPYSSTFTGRTQVNGGLTYPYNVVPKAGSTYKWLISGGEQVSGTSTPSITATWALPGSDSVNGHIRVIETNQFGCIGDTGMLAPVTVYRLDIGDTTIASVCKKDVLVIKTGITGSFIAGNMLTAQLSNASGSFTTPTATVTIPYSGSGVNKLATINLLISDSLANGTGYRVRIMSSNPVFTGDTTSTIIIRGRPTASTITGRTQVNGGITYPYNVAPSAGSTYKWLIGSGVQVSGTSTPSITATWAVPGSDSVNGHIRVVETNQFGCIGDTGMLAPVTVYRLDIADTASASVCKGNVLVVKAGITGSFEAGNMLTAQLSNADGNFTTPTATVTVAYTGSGVNKLATLNLPISHNLANGAGYKVRILSSNPVFTGDTTSAIIISGRPTAPTLTGRTQVNGGLTYPYNVVPNAGSTFKWLMSSGVQVSGTNTHSITGTWAVPGMDSVNSNIRAIETNQYGCVGDTGILTPVTVYRLDIGDTASASVCKGGVLVVKTGITGSFDAGNILTAQLSNASGNFNTPTATATLAYTGTGVNQSATFTIPIPANLPNGNGYRVRIRSSLPVFTGDSTANIAIQKPALGADVTGAYCQGLSYNLTQHFTGNPLTYSYYTQAFAPVPAPSSVLAGIYQVIGSNSFGCSDTAQVTVSLLAQPILEADTMVSLVCAGETTNLLPLYNTGSMTTVWNTGNPSSVGQGTYRLIVTNAQGCKDTAFAEVILPKATWTGAVSTNWHTPGNWNTGKVPDASTHVFIQGITPHICIISQENAYASSVQLKNGGTLQQTNGKQLIVEGKCAVLPSP